jgi:hypothetical protein
LKIYRYIQNYKVEILKESFVLSEERNLKNTAKISFYDVNNNLIDTKKYGVVDLETIYNKIIDKESIDVSKCYIKNFSLNDFREKNNLSPKEKVDLINFTAIDSIFESEKVIDFSLANFIGEKVNFSNTHFGLGNLSFLKAEFGDFPVLFKATSYSEGNNIFQYSKFNNGNVNFDNSTFENGNLSFVNTYFGDGNTSFKNIHFGNGDVSFAFSTFNKGSISFDKSIFNGDEISFSKVDFGSGKVDFRRVVFGDGDIDFEEISLATKNKVVFRRADFGSSSVSFRDAHLEGCSVDFEEAEFKNGKLNFFKLTAKSISLNHCFLNCNIDMRIDDCHTIDISQSIVHNIIDLNPGLTKMNIQELNLSGVRNMGDIFIAWDDNHVLDLISNQKSTSLHEKAEQFRLLKEEFRDTGRYLDEDVAYVYFKRYELMSEYELAKKNGIVALILFMPNFLFQRLVFDKVGLYATNPFRVLFSIVIVNFIFSLIYTFFHTKINTLTCLSEEISFLDQFFGNLYFSAITFFTVGYGDCSPLGFFKLLAPIEGFVGVFLMSYFTVAFVRKILR